MENVYLDGSHNEWMALIQIMHAAGCGVEYEEFLNADREARADPHNRWKAIRAKFTAETYFDVKPPAEEVPTHLLKIYRDVVERLLAHGYRLEMM